MVSFHSFREQRIPITLFVSHRVTIVPLLTATNLTIILAKTLLNVVTIQTLHPFETIPLPPIPVLLPVSSANDQVIVSPNARRRQQREVNPRLLRLSMDNSSDASAILYSASHSISIILAKLARGPMPPLITPAPSVARPPMELSPASAFDHASPFASIDIGDFLLGLLYHLPLINSFLTCILTTCQSSQPHTIQTDFARIVTP